MIGISCEQCTCPCMYLWHVWSVGLNRLIFSERRVSLLFDSDSHATDIVEIVQWTLLTAKSSHEYRKGFVTMASECLFTTDSLLSNPHVFLHKVYLNITCVADWSCVTHLSNCDAITVKRVSFSNITTLLDCRGYGWPSCPRWLNSSYSDSCLSTPLVCSCVSPKWKCLRFASTSPDTPWYNRKNAQVFEAALN